jgi:hypothetical protein
MDISKFKDFLRNYSSLLVPIVIALTGVAFFIPTQLMGGKLKEQIKRSSLSKGMDLGMYSGSDAISARQWGIEGAYQRAHGEDANLIELAARQSGQRPLLSYGVFPEPRDASVMLIPDFGRQLRASVERIVADVNGGDCPTTAQLDDIKNAYKTRSRSYRKSGREVEAALRDGLCQDRAKSCSVYANPEIFDVYHFWDEYKYSDATTKDEPIEHCWYSQLAFWIIEDVVHTIGVMNAESRNVLDSPVKRLMELTFPGVRTKSRSKRPGARVGRVARGRKGSRSGMSDKPGYVLSLDRLRPGSCTRRVSEDYIDVVRFQTSVVLDSGAILPFMKELCSAKEHKFRGWDGRGPEKTFEHNQVTILEYRITPVNREKDNTHKFYRYGKGAVVKLDLTCEYIFSVDACKEVKPPAIAKAIEQIRSEIQAEKAKRDKRAAYRARRQARAKSGGSGAGE